MSKVTVGRLAELINIDKKILFKKLQNAGIMKDSYEDFITDEEKNKLLEYIRNPNVISSKKDFDSTPSIVFQKKTVKQLKILGNNRKVKVQVLETRKISSNIPKENYISSNKVPDNNSENEYKRSFPSKIKNVSVVKQETNKKPSTFLPKINTNIKTTINKEGMLLGKDNPSKMEEIALSNISSLPDKKKSFTQITKKKKIKRNLKNLCGEEETRPAKSLFQTKEDNYSRKFKNQKNNNRFSNLHLIEDNVSEDSESEVMISKKKNSNQKKLKVNSYSKKIIKKIILFEGITLSEIANKVCIKIKELTDLLIKRKILSDHENYLTLDTAILIVKELGHKYVIHKEESFEKEALSSINSSSYKYKLRPPVVTVMGHVDHGKTSLLDCIRKTRVALKEIGGITQHIGAYTVNVENIKKGDTEFENDFPIKKITFLDTPGHESFSAMRVRGVKVTDIIVLVVAADDGVMPQTIEAINHAKSAKVPLIVAVNKIDLKGTNLDKIKTDLSQHDVISEDWNGDVMFINVSAKQNQGIDNLLNAILLQSEILELKSIQEGSARGIVIESNLQRGYGPVATVLVQAGSLKRGSVIVCGSEFGRVRSMLDDSGKKISQASSSIPVKISGLSGVPNVGDELLVVKDEKTARELSKLRLARKKDDYLEKKNNYLKKSMIFKSLEDDKEEAKINKVHSFDIILRADTQGSAEAISNTLLHCCSSNDNEKYNIKVNIISSGIGGITVSDINLAMVSSNPLIFAFNVPVYEAANKLAESENIKINHHNIIYDLVDEMKEFVSKKISPENNGSEIVGLVEVKSIFNSSKFGLIAGCFVSEGLVKKNYPIKIFRNDIPVHEDIIFSLKRFKQDTNEVKKNMECGIALKAFKTIQVGDLIKVFKPSIS